MKNKFADDLVIFFNNAWRSFTVITLFFLLFVFIRICVFSFQINRGGKDYLNSNFKVFSHIPKDLNFAGEIVPVSNFSTAQNIEKELPLNTFSHYQTNILFKRANRWFPLIESIMKKYKIPDDFKYLVIVESGLTNIVSPANATGYWQLLESTAINYNLEIDEDVDERYNMERSTEAACKYFIEAYKRLNNWTLVAASYNLGIGGIEAQLKKQNVSSYYDLYLNQETSRYIFRVLVIKDMMTRPQVYGITLRENDLYSPLPTIKVKIDSSIMDLSAFALTEGVNYRTFKLLNPWLRKDFLKNPDRKIYHIEIPKKGIDFTKWELSLLADSSTTINSVRMIGDSLRKL